MAGDYDVNRLAQGVLSQEAMNPRASAQIMKRAGRFEILVAPEFLLLMRDHMSSPTLAGGPIVAFLEGSGSGSAL